MIVLVPAASAEVAPGHPLSFPFAGDANYATSSGTVKQMVKKFAHHKRESSAPNPSSSGQSVTCVTVTSTNRAIPEG